MTDLPAIVTVLGVPGDDVGRADPDGFASLARAAVVAGGRRHLDAWRAWAATTGASTTARVIEIGADAGAATEAICTAAVAGESPVVVLASGDPGFFGIVRALGRQADQVLLRVLPAPSSVALAFARIGHSWDDAVVASAHGRPLAAAVAAVARAPKAAVLTSPDAPPEAVGRALLAALGTRADAGRDVWVCSRLGCGDETVRRLSLEELAGGTFDPLSVVVVERPAPVGGPNLAWGLPEGRFAHRDGMVTKAEVRAIVLGKLAVPPAGVLWDVGAGSGSVGIECARLAPALEVHAWEADAAARDRVAQNATDHGVTVRVHGAFVPGEAGDAPDPDRVFVGGGGIEVLEGALARLRPGGRVVATYAAVDRAARAADLVGGLVQVGVARGTRLADGGWRLAAANPVFIAFGPGGDGGTA